MTLEELDEAWQILTDREKTVITKRFGLNGSKPETLEQIGKIFGVTRERIRQHQNEALSKLRRVGHQLRDLGEIQPSLLEKKEPRKTSVKPVVKRKKKSAARDTMLPPQPPVPKCSEKKRLNWLERWITGSGTAIRRSLDGITLFDDTGGVKIHAADLRELIDRAIHGKVLP